MADSADVLMAVFEKQNKDGTYHYSDAEVRHALPLVMLTGVANGQLEALPDAVTDLVSEMLVAAGVTSEDKPNALGKKVAAFYKAKPPNKELLGALSDVMGKEAERLVAEAGKAAAKAAGALTGKAAPSNVPLANRPAPKGAVGGGTLARLRANKTVDKAGAKKG